MQNSPQFVIAYYGILRADAVVVPLNPMNLTQEFLRCARDAGATTVVVSQELYPRIEPLIGGARSRACDRRRLFGLFESPTDLPVPDVHFRAARRRLSRPGVTLWRDVAAERAISGTFDDRTR